MECQKDKFNFSEAFNNKDGKTSGSGTIGIALSIVGGLCFIAAQVGWYLNIPGAIEIMQQTIVLIGAASLLLGVRKFNA